MGYSEGPRNTTLSEFENQPGPNRAVRGILTGMLLGAVLWCGILVLTGVVKL